jgi:hypothetical protein
VRGEVQGLHGARRFVLVLFNGDRPAQGDFVLVRAKDYGELLDKAGER